MPEDQNPLRHHLDAELRQSHWLQQFKTWSLFLNTLKTEVPLTQLCELQWVTADHSLIIHCPNPEIRTALEHEAIHIQSLNTAASSVILRHSEFPDLKITA